MQYFKYWKIFNVLFYVFIYSLFIFLNIDLLDFLLFKFNYIFNFDLKI